MSHNRLLTVVFPLFAAALAPACTQTEVADTPVSQIVPGPLSATLTVTADGSGATAARGCLSDDGIVCRQNGDMNVAVASDPAKPLVFQPVWISTDGTVVGEYHGRMATDVPGTSFAIGWSAPQGAAPRSTVTLPAPFEIFSPPPGMQFDTGWSAVKVRWQPSGGSDRIRWRSDGSCPLRSWSSPGQDDLPDRGYVVIPLDRFDTSELTPGDSCTVTIEISRYRSGKIDPGFPGGGTIVGEQVRSVTIDLMRPAS